MTRLDPLGLPIMAGVFFVLGVLAYAPVLTSFFLSDDFFYLSQIVHLDWPNVLLLQPGVFRPLHVVSWLVDYHLWGLNPLGYHLTNIISHCLVALFVFVLARQLFELAIPEPDAKWAAPLAGLVFLVHPSHTEAVSWIIGRHDIFAALFVLFAWYAYSKFRQTSHLVYLAASLCALLIALFFKESALSFPLILVAFEGWLLLARMLIRVDHAWRWRQHQAGAGGRAASRTMWALASYMLVIAVYLLVRRLTSGEVVSEFESPFIRPSLAIFANLSATVFRSFLPYFPVQLLVEAPKLGLSTITVAVLGVVGGVAAVFWLVTNVLQPTPVKLLASFLIVTMIVSAFPTLSFGRPSIIDSEAERYAYLPSVFAAMLVSLSVVVLFKPRIVRAGVAASVLVFFVAFLELSNQNWRTAGELTASVLESVAAQPASADIAVLVVPDSLNGAFVYRNGLPEALSLFGPQPGPRVSIVGWAFLRRADERIALDQIGSSTYAVTMPVQRGTLVPSTDGLPSDLSLTRVDLYRFNVSVQGAVHAAYYSEGRMHFEDIGPVR